MTRTFRVSATSAICFWPRSSASDRRVLRSSRHVRSFSSLSSFFESALLMPVPGGASILSCAGERRDEDPAFPFSFFSAPSFALPTSGPELMSMVKSSSGEELRGPNTTQERKYGGSQPGGFGFSLRKYCSISSSTCLACSRAVTPSSAAPGVPPTALSPSSAGAGVSPPVLPPSWAGPGVPSTALAPSWAGPGVPPTAISPVMGLRDGPNNSSSTAESLLASRFLFASPFFVCSSTQIFVTIASNRSPH